MPGDFSRKRSTQSYALVELKQGGLLLDSDFNEAMGSFERAGRALASDVLGRATVSRSTPNAFRISADPNGGLLIGRGRLYADGLLAENRGEPSSPAVFDPLMAEPVFTQDVNYAAQPFFPGAPALPSDGRYLVYLDVWQREVTHLEQPDLVESAVGVETSSRLQTVWQVRLLGVDRTTTCATPDRALFGWAALNAPSSGVLSTGTFDVAAVDDPCELPPTGGYRGLENQLYRVEIHTAGQPGAGATFKWSREGGSVGSIVTSIVSATELELATLGRDDVLGFKSGDWVEILDDVREFSLAPGEMRKITLDGSRIVRLDKPLPTEMLPTTLPSSMFPRERHLRVRAWNHRGRVLRADPSNVPVEIQNLDDPTSTGVIRVPAAGTAVLLEDGITVSFDAAANGQGFKTGDYWLFAARTADASVELLDRQPPRGIHHHYARLAVWDAPNGAPSDCRTQWPPTTTGETNEVHDCGCTACVTVESHVDRSLTIQQAVDQVNANGGGTVCLGPGLYRLDSPLKLSKVRQVVVRGQGAATLLSSASGAFVLEECRAVGIERLAIQTSGTLPAIAATHVLNLTLQDLEIEARSTVATAIALDGIAFGIAIRRNALIAATGILAPSAANRDSEPLLVLGDLQIEDNALACRNRGIHLAEGGIRARAARITSNEIVGCNDIGIRVSGTAARDSTLTVAGNRLHVSGDGIQGCADGVWFENNSVVLANTGSSKGQNGIEVAATSLGTRRCQILANQVSGFASAGIAVTGEVGDLIIKLNIIESCGNGIFSTSTAADASVSIENNHLRQIGAEEGGRRKSIGILASNAKSAAISGNTIDGLGQLAAQAQLRAAILTLAVEHSAISNNEVRNVAHHQTGTSAGILLHAPLAEFNVSLNRVEDDAPDETGAARGAWFALTTARAENADGVLHTADFTTVTLGARALVLGAGAPVVSTFAGANRGAESERASVLGNVLSARATRGTPAVRVTAIECLFNDNRVQLTGDWPFAVELTTKLPIVNANRVHGGEKSSISIQGTRTAAAVGNITTTEIQVDGGFLQSPWRELNIVS